MTKYDQCNGCWYCNINIEQRVCERTLHITLNKSRLKDIKLCAFVYGVCAVCATAIF